MGDISYIGLGRASEAELANSPPDEKVVELLEKLLADARSGKIKSLAMAGVSNLGEFLNASAGQGDFAKLLGAIQILDFRLKATNIHIP